MPDAAIVIPCFNQARFVRQAVSSALDQTHRDLEVIVIDDGSSEDVPSALRSLTGDPRLQIVRQDNAGVGPARNRGLERVTAGSVMFLDADDYLHPDKIARQQALLDRQPDVGLALCDITAVEGPSASETITVNLERLEIDDLLTALLPGGLFPPCVPLARTSLVRAAGGFSTDRALAGHADYLLWLQLGAMGVRHALVREKLAYYRLRPDGMSQDRNHMAESRRLAIEQVARTHPAEIAAALCRLGERHTDAWHAARWMREAMGRVLQHTEELKGSLASVERERLAEAERRERAEQRVELLDTLRQTAAASEVVIWGCGARGRQALDFLRQRGVDVRGWLDSDLTRTTSILEGLVVHEPRAWLTMQAQQAGPLLIVIASMHHQDIRATLDVLSAQTHVVVRHAIF